MVHHIPQANMDAIVQILFLNGYRLLPKDDNGIDADDDYTYDIVDEESHIHLGYLFLAGDEKTASLSTKNTHILNLLT